MSPTDPPNFAYQTGGSLPVNAPSYVSRQADDILYDALLAGEFCYVLNSRQMGKSSLRVQTMHRLRQVGVACGVIDITSIGSYQITPEEWYLGVIRRLVRSFNLSVKPLVWWQNHAGISPTQRLGEFIEDVLLAEISSQIVVFIDEIDSILSVPFKDDFFALIRACFNQRAEDAKYQRLTFALLGVTTPADLIADKTRTPFNIGQAIELRGFSLEEAKPLLAGLITHVSDSNAALQAILKWTRGQPFLTQKLCHLIQQAPTKPKLNDAVHLQVANLVWTRLINNWEAQDEPEYLRTIRGRLLCNDRSAGSLLGLYQKVLQSHLTKNPKNKLQKSVRADDSLEQIELRLSGLVVERHGYLRIYNPIYFRVFNANWVQHQLAELRPYAESLMAWIASNCEDESRLLQGQALEAAQIWASGKSLSDRDYQFLTASEKLHNRQLTELNWYKQHHINELQRQIEINLQRLTDFSENDFATFERYQRYQQSMNYFQKILDQLTYLTTNESWELQIGYVKMPLSRWL